MQRSVFVLLTMLFLAGCGGSGISPSQVAAAAGATTCDNSGLYLQNGSTAAKEAIYDCRFRAALPKCVTYAGDIASDATTDVALLFARSLNARKPACLKWHAQALHQRQVVAAKRAALKGLYSGLLGGSGQMVAKAKKEVAKNPVKGYRDLTNAYISRNDLRDAIAALQSYLVLRKTDASAWAQLAGYEKQQGDAFTVRYQQAQQQSEPSASSLYQRASSLYRESLSDFENAAKYATGGDRAGDELAVFTAAQLTGNTTIGLRALQMYVQLAPDSPNLEQIEAECKSLGGSCVPKHHK